MKLSYLPGDLHLFTDKDGFVCLALKGEAIGRFRSQKEGIRRFNEIRTNLEKEHPARELSQDEKHELMVKEIGDTLTRHNRLLTCSGILLRVLVESDRIHSLN